MAIDMAKQKIDKYHLANVTPVLLGNHSNTILDHSADVVYALDMFHQVDDPVNFLAGIHRITKPEGVLCPVNCNSHAACSIVKNLGKKHNKTVHILANSSLSTISQVIRGGKDGDACTLN